MMAISTSLTAGKLEIVEADTADNDFAIVGTGNPGEITVSGRNGTAVNGVMDGSVTISGVTGDLDVRIQSNTNNNIHIDNVYIAGNL
jgi:hypothetical protein